MFKANLRNKKNQLFNLKNYGKSWIWKLLLLNIIPVNFNYCYIYQLGWHNLWLFKITEMLKLREAEKFDTLYILDVFQGFDTTSMAITFTLMLLAYHTDIQVTTACIYLFFIIHHVCNNFSKKFTKRCWILWNYRVKCS